MLANARQGWRAIHRDTLRWDKTIAALVAHIRPQAPLRRARLRLSRFSVAIPDWDGLAISFKHPVDALVSAGILVDDSLAHIGFPRCVHVRVPTLADQGIMLEVVALDDAESLSGAV